ncbi:hypothetical protein [Pleomorphomonas koreensis]|uniref:hypothetical protein n=1 Tax=Pleomorphomonas koreensis TaxID=257440 RepID=UPI000422C169|nr:hypothetical protein [Pleomorphomonas koreensis]
MIRRVLVLFAFLTLALVSAASAHEHGGHAMPAATGPTMPAALPDAMPILDHAAAQLNAAADAAACIEGADICHDRGKPAACTCPAACAGLFDVVVAAPSMPAVAMALPPCGVRRLLPLAAPPPTPPPRA